MLNLFGGILFKLGSFVLIGLIVLSQAQSPFASDLQPLISKKQLEPIAAIVDKAIRESKIPGAVLLIGNQEKVVYRRAFGFRTLVPKKLPMAEDTIFDIASLTKVIATTTAVMQLVEEGKLQLDAPVALYWPAFKANGKSGITVRQLLTHYSGLQPDLELKHKWSGYSKAMKMIVAERPVSPPGTSYIYSDINFEILGDLVQRVSGKPLDVYCAEHIFKPLGMKNTFFNPPMSLQNRIAPTQYQNGKNGKLLWGEVHDPTAHRMGGVAGHAGLFSTAYDLARFANMLLCGGSFKGARVLTTATIDIMTLPQTPPESMPLRGLGWNIDAPFGSNRNTLFPIGSFGHKGYTGTLIWIDPVSRTYVIILTSRVHPYGKGDADPLRKQIMNLVSGALGPLSENHVLSRRPSLTRYYELMKSYRGRVQTGIDVLEKEKFAPLTGLRLGIVTNHSGLDSAGRRTIDLLDRAPDLKLVALFSPEHGLSCTSDDKVLAALLGIEIVSALYRLYPGDFRLDKALDIIGSRKVVQAIRDGLDPKTVTLQWSKDLERFKKLRSKYLLY